MEPPLQLLSADLNSRGRKLFRIRSVVARPAQIPRDDEIELKRAVQSERCGNRDLRPLLLH